MIDPRPERGIPEDQQTIRIHDGWIVSTASEIDDRMAQVGTWFTDRDLSDTSRSQWVARTQKQKREEIAKCFPRNWRDGEMLIDRTKKCFGYRNEIGHGYVSFRFTEDGRVVWQRKSSKKTEEIVVDEFQLWETRFTYVHRAWTLMIYPGVPMMRDYDVAVDGIGIKNMLAEEIDDLASEEQRRWHAVHRWMFPPAK
jgi:hypothetical protein